MRLGVSGLGVGFQHPKSQGRWLALCWVHCNAALGHLLRDAAVDWPYFQRECGCFLGQALRDRASAQNGRARRGRAGVVGAAGWMVLLLVTAMAMAQDAQAP